MLKPRKKLTKREIKEDGLVTTYFRVQKYFKKHQKIIQYTLMGLAAVVVISVLMVRSKKNTERAVIEKMGIAEQYYYTGNTGKAVEMFKEIIETYPGAEASRNAVFLLANSYFSKQDYDQAEKYFRLFYEKYNKNDIFTASSLAGIAACMESKNEFAEAAAMYEKAGKKSEGSFEAPFHLENAARCYLLAGDKEAGKRIYQMILDRYPKSELNRQNEFILQSL